MNRTAIRLHEYRNDFFFISFREAPGRGPGAFLFNCAVNIPRFDPLCWGKGGVGNNPVMKGLQLLRTYVSAFAKNHGMAAGKAGVQQGTSVPLLGDGWFREEPLLIEGASPAQVREMIEFSAVTLVQSILNSCFPGPGTPVVYKDPEEMQQFLQSLGVRDYKEAAIRLRRSRESRRL